jgi:SAM-dependent methyltransferase
MLASLQKSWNISNGKIILRCIEADLQEPLPIPDESIHIVFTIATFHILKKWREALQNLVRVLTPGGFIIFICENNQFMHETEGFEKDSDFIWLDAQLRDFMHYYHQQRSIVGEPYQPRELRYSDMMLGICYLSNMGLKEQQLNFPTSTLEWDKPHTYKDILHCFRNRQMTTWGSDLSDEARDKIAKALDEWVLSQGIDINREFLLPAKIIPHVFLKTR